MQIHGLNQVQGPQQISGTHANRPATGVQRPAAQQVVDQLDISAAAQAALSKVDQPEVRTDLVARLRAEIASGSYETSDKISTSIDRLLDELAAGS